MKPDQPEAPWADPAAVSPPGPCEAPPGLPLVEELTGAGPWEACRRLARLPYLLFLDSADPHPTLGRYSFVTADPFAVLRARGADVSWSCHGPGPHATGGPAPEAADPFTA